MGQCIKTVLIVKYKPLSVETTCIMKWSPVAQL